VQKVEERILLQMQELHLNCVQKPIIADSQKDEENDEEISLQYLFYPNNKT
jgi:hypothetical protein